MGRDVLSLTWVDSYPEAADWLEKDWADATVIEVDMGSENESGFLASAEACHLVCKAREISEILIEYLGELVEINELKGFPAFYIPYSVEEVRRRIARSEGKINFQYA